MKKPIGILLSAIIAVSALIPSVSAVADGPNHGKVPKVSGIVMDGTKDAGYANGLVIDFTRVNANIAAENIAQGDLKTTGAQGTLTLVWDTGYLYVFADIKDENTGYEYTEDQFKANQTNFENIAFILDLKNDGQQANLFRMNYYSYLHYIHNTINADGTQSNVSVENLKLADAIGKYEMIGKKVTGGWTAEAKIPIDTLTAGAKIGFFGQLTDKDDTGANVTPVNTGWTPHTDPTAGPWYSPKYGYIELSNDTKATPGLVTTGTAGTTTPPPTTDTTAPSTGTTPPKTEGTTTPATGDNVIYILAAGLLAGAIVFIRKKAVR